MRRALTDLCWDAYVALSWRVAHGRHIIYIWHLKFDIKIEPVRRKMKSCNKTPQGGGDQTRYIMQQNRLQSCQAARLYSCSRLSVGCKYSDTAAAPLAAL